MNVDDPAGDAPAARGVAGDPLAALRAGGASALAVQFAGAVLGWCGIARGRGDAQACAVAALAAGLVEELAAGSVCIDLAAPAPELPAVIRQYLAPLQPAAGAPAGADLLVGLAAIGGPGEARPLVRSGSRVWLHRHYTREQAVAASLRERAAEDAALPMDAAARDRARRLLAALFPDDPAAPGGVQWQRVGAAMALLRSLTVITGGPGTGKTTTVAGTLAVLQALHPSAHGAASGSAAAPAALRIRVAAPTGKAAARLIESMAATRARLLDRARAVLPPADADAVDAALAALPERGETLHRLLGWRPADDDFRHDRDDPLAADVVVVDEASMLDLRLVDRLLRALPRHARLILLGDPDQLASVDAGHVLADIVAGVDPDATGQRFSAAAAARLAALTGYDLAALGGARTEPLADAICVLRTSRRFGRDSAIGRIAAAVHAGDPAAFDAVLAAGAAGAAGGTGEAGRAPAVGHAADDVRWIGASAALAVDHAAAQYATVLAEVAAGADATTVLAAQARFRVLAAVRDGSHGVVALNEQVERALRARGFGHLLARGCGRPVMVLRNDPSRQLFNGDVGVLLDDPHGGGIRAAFADGAGGVRWLVPATLPQHETVWAMTVHKSQGSEFDEVLLVLPPAGGPDGTADPALLGRELLYTALTRARQRVVLVAGREQPARIIGRRTRRRGGLGEALWGASMRVEV